MTPERFERIRSVVDRRQPDLTVVLEEVREPHNLSAIVRTCDAAGVFEAHALAPDGGAPYPELGPEGEILGELPRG